MRTETFDHLTDLLLVDVVAIHVNKCAQEILEAIEDFGAWSQHADPFTH